MFYSNNINKSVEMFCELCHERDSRLRPSKNLIFFKFISNDEIYDRECCRKCLALFFKRITKNVYELSLDGEDLVNKAIANIIDEIIEIQ